MSRGELVRAAALLRLVAGCGSSSTAPRPPPAGWTSRSAASIRPPANRLDASGCTAADRELWGNFGRCLSGLPGCTAGNTTPFTTGVVACTTTLSDGLSPACEW